MSAAPAAAADAPEALGEALRTFFRQASPQVLLALLGATLAARLALGAFSVADLVVVAAVVAWWPFQEWLLHRTLLHLRPFRLFGRRIDFAFARRHRAHHREPWRPELIFLPIWVHLLAPLVALLFVLVLPTPGLACSAMAALVAMALLYEWVHFLVHSRFWPRRPWLQQLWRNHRLHHFKSERHWFGFTVASVDRLFGTAPDPRTIPTSGTCRTLGVED